MEKCIVSFFGVGYIRPLSATWGSLASGFVLYWFWPTVAFEYKVLAIIAVFLIGWGLSHRVELKSGLHDPHFIVIDEVVGMMIVTAFLSQIWWHWVLAFFFFRLFDIAKFWPASIFDEEPGGFAIMFDDVLMALLSVMTLHLSLYLIAFSLS